MENKVYFYLNGNVKVGPLSFDALRYAPISPNTLVWNNSLPDWVEARSLPELVDMFVSMPTQFPSPPPPPPVTQRYHTTGSGFSNVGMKPPMPENYMIWAVLTTLFCFWPLGVFSFVCATKVSSAYFMGDYAGAKKASDNAKKLAIWATVLGSISYILYFIVIFLWIRYKKH